MNSFKAQFEKFTVMETKHDLFSIDIQGAPIWKIMRFILFHDVYDTDFHSFNRKKRSLLGSIYRKFIFVSKSIFFLKKNPFFLGNRKILFFSHSRTIYEDEDWVDKYTHYFTKELDHDYGMLCFNSDIKNKPMNNDNVKYSNFIIAFSNLLRITKYRSLKLSEQNKIDIEFIHTTLSLYFGDIPNLTNRILNLVKKWKSETYIYEKLLKKINPKIAIVVVAYDKESFVHICNKLDIKVIELQHGVLSDYNIAYIFPPNIETIYLDYLFTFGEYWNKFNKLNGDCEIKTIGFPYIENRKVLYKSFKREKIILFISQPTVGEEFSDLAAECLDHLPNDYKIIFKLHPFEEQIWEEKYKKLRENLGDKLEVADHNADLYQLLSRAEISVGVYSTAVFEGLYFGIKTLIYQSPLSEHLSELIENNIVTPISTAREIITELTNSSVSDSNKPEFFVDGGVTRFNNLINEIIEKD